MLIYWESEISGFLLGHFAEYSGWYLLLVQFVLQQINAYLPYPRETSGTTLNLLHFLQKILGFQLALLSVSSSESVAAHCLSTSCCTYVKPTKKCTHFDGPVVLIAFHSYIECMNVETERNIKSKRIQHVISYSSATHNTFSHFLLSL
jgi:hypothetical protein